MEAWIAWLVGGPRFITQSLAGYLRDGGFGVVEDRPEQPSELARTIAIVVCEDHASWDALEELADVGLAGRVAIMDRYDLDRYARAFSGGAGAVHLDSSPETIVDVVRARGRGEILAPVGCVSRLAGAEETSRLSPMERELLRGLAANDTVATIAERVNFSERTVRRRLQSLYFRLGVPDRSSAIVAARALLA